MVERENRNSEINLINDERKHLEGLLKDRINFHLIFASVFMAGLSNMDDLSIRKWALAAITAISLVIFLAVLRTFLLVRQALEDIKACDPAPPYSRYYKTVQRWFPINASFIMILVPAILTLAFLMATYKYWHYSSDQPLSGRATYQIEDHSDRHVANDQEPSSGGSCAATGTATKATDKTAKHSSHPCPSPQH